MNFRLSIKDMIFQVLYKIWPGINHFTKEILTKTIQPSILERLADYKIKGFQFDRMVLGRIVRYRIYY